MFKLVFFLYDTEDGEKDEQIGVYFSSCVPRRSELVTLKGETYKVINIEYIFIESLLVKDTLQEVHIFLEII